MFPIIPQNRFILEGALEIHNGGQNARFGSSLAPVPDLNGDGFNDLVVGAPLEDDHKGAIYVFFSQHNRIIRKYKQVGSLQKVLLTDRANVFGCFFQFSYAVNTLMCGGFTWWKVEAQFSHNSQRKIRRPTVVMTARQGNRTVDWYTKT